MKTKPESYREIFLPWMKGIALSIILSLVPLEIHADERVRDEDATRKKSWEVLKREAYYHYFIEDYLTAGTRLKLIEASGENLNDARIVNEAKILLGSLYLAWGMEHSAVRAFAALDVDTPPGEKRDQLLLKVVKMQYERSRYQDALETYRLMLPGGPPDPIALDRYPEQARYLAALSHYASGSIQKGIKGLKTLPPDSPYFPFAQLTLAKSYYQLNDSAKSLLYLKDLSETDIRRRRHLGTLVEKSRLTWGQVLMEEGHFKGARRVLANIPPKSPFFPDALFGIGWSYFREEKYLEAILVFQDLIQIAPDHDYALEALTVVGHGYQKLGIFQRALDHYTGAIEIYIQKAGELRLFQQTFDDPGGLARLFREKMDKRSALPGFLKDERIRFWVSQYEDLLKLESHLDRKLRETGIFEERLSHREALSPQVLPVVQRFSGGAEWSGLRVAVPEPAKDHEPFRRRIASARADLLGMRERTIALREALLPPLRGILLSASGKWLNRIVRLVAEAELSQIQILDGQDGGMKP